ncbi:alpha/beta hydrolase [uncultured Roseobacter sp.]|uniref:alpha/beta hydrolase n=1 Tax=uncultured Roseobacter sp. TaxID=114847 RepID=UPI00262220D0|nr:alpha/beta hydrolase [uncultured Roseobacter sp.]
MNGLTALVLGLVLVLSACGIRDAVLAPPPNLYATGKNYPTDTVPVPLRNTAPRIFYVTGRNPEPGPDGTVSYGLERSESMAFGTARVRFGAADWDDLVARTHQDGKRSLSSLEVERIDEVVRFREVPLATERTDGELIFDPEQKAEYDAGGEAFKAAVRAEIARTGNRRILIFTHGVRNDFTSSVTSLANLWHFTGRGSIPIAFTWPAGNAGLLGYFRDREAGDFSVFHAKEMLRLLAEMPEVEDIDIVAHSRGTDVMAKALRELVIYHRGRGKLPKTAMKTGTLILAAADLDTGVVRQRLQAERFSEAFEQINIYINPTDGALRLSSFLGNVPRLGSATAETLTPQDIARLGKAELVFFIRAENIAGTGHSYFRNNPAVLSDIVLTLRTRAFPGGTLRPLEQGADGFWQLHPNYPLERLPDLSDAASRREER